MIADKGNKRIQILGYTPPQTLWPGYEKEVNITPAKVEPLYSLGRMGITPPDLFFNSPSSICVNSYHDVTIIDDVQRRASILNLNTGL